MTEKAAHDLDLGGENEQLGINLKVGESGRDGDEGASRYDAR